MEIDHKALETARVWWNRQNNPSLNGLIEAYEVAKSVEQPVELCEADSYNLECKISGMGVSHEILKINFPDPEVRRKVIWVVQLLQMNAVKALERESVLPAPETLNKNETIDVIRRIQRESMELAEPYQKRLVAYAMSEPPAPVVTEQGTYVYTGPLPAAPEVKRNDIEDRKL